jgi:peptide chain release factor
MTELWLQITVGHGPSECALAVVKVLKQIQREAAAASLGFHVVEIEPGMEPGTALVSIVGSALEPFARAWQGTVQWIPRSPFRPEHRRRNWFVGVKVIEPLEEAGFDARDVRWETTRAS